MKIGFKFQNIAGWQLGSLNPGQGRSFLGDEALALFLRKEILKFPEVKYCELFNEYPEDKLDIIIYFNREKLDFTKAKKHIVYFQNAFLEGNDKVLNEFQKMGFNGFIFASKKLFEYHKSKGYSGIYLPFATDPELFRPTLPEDRYKFDVTYVGNNIKGTNRTVRYVYPATKFKFGLFGHWYYKGRKINRPYYMKLFKRISQGQIPMEDLPVLYSSAKIVLNCTIQGHIDWDVIVGRVYDVMACNAFLISDEIPSAKERFGHIIEFSKGGRDLIKKIKYYLKHEKERVERASKGRGIILKSETYTYRAKTMLEYFKRIF